MTTPLLCLVFYGLIALWFFSMAAIAACTGSPRLAGQLLVLSFLWPVVVARRFWACRSELWQGIVDGWRAP